MAPERTIECSPKGRAKLKCLALIMPVLMIVGIVFLSIGLPMLINSSTYNPAVDFETVPGDCTVVSSREVSSYKYGRPSRTYYIYAYQFSTVADPTTVVEGGDVDSRTVGGQQPWAAGTRKKCWRRAAIWYSVLRFDDGCFKTSEVSRSDTVFFLSVFFLGINFCQRRHGVSTVSAAPTTSIYLLAGVSFANWNA